MSPLNPPQHNIIWLMLMYAKNAKHARGLLRRVISDEVQSREKIERDTQGHKGTLQNVPECPCLTGLLCLLPLSDFIILLLLEFSLLFFSLLCSIVTNTFVSSSVFPLL